MGSELSFVTVTVKDAADDHVIWDLAWVSPHTEERAANAIFTMCVYVCGATVEIWKITNRPIRYSRHVHLVTL